MRFSVVAVCAASLLGLGAAPAATSTTAPSMPQSRYPSHEQCWAGVAERLGNVTLISPCGSNTRWCYNHDRLGTVRCIPETTSAADEQWSAENGARVDGARRAEAERQANEQRLAEQRRLDAARAGEQQRLQAALQREADLVRQQRRRPPAPVNPNCNNPNNSGSCVSPQ